MASQVAHIVYAGKYLDRVKSEKFSAYAPILKKYPFEKYEQLFLLGVCFPDIRRVDQKIKRSDTHIILNNLNCDLHYLEPFSAGWKFHLYCDMRREEILNNLGFYNYSDTDDLQGLPAKLLEDEIIYDNYYNWEKITKIFNKPPKIEIPNFVSRETFEIWYAILAKYFELKPNNASMLIFLRKQLKLADIAGNIIGKVDKLRKNDKVVELLRNVKEEIMIIP